MRENGPLASVGGLFSWKIKVVKQPQQSRDGFLPTCADWHAESFVVR